MWDFDTPVVRVYFNKLGDFNSRLSFATAVYI